MRLIDWMRKFRIDDGLQPFVGKAIPDVPDEDLAIRAAANHLAPSLKQISQLKLVLEWQDTALKMARECGRVRKGNSFSFTMSDVRSSVTVPEATYDLFVAAAIIDERGHVL